MDFEVVVEDKPKKDYEEFPDAEDEEEITPDHYYDGGKIPVFKPTMKQFESFKKFVDKINHYGMKSGIVKIIAPQEWIDALPPLDAKVKDIRIKNPIVQHIIGNSGTFRQTNLEKQRTYNLPQWRQLCEGSDHQPPAKRGERRLGQTAKVHRLTGRRSNRSKKAEEEPEEEPKKTKAPPSPMSPSKVKDEVVEEDEEGTPAPKTDAKGRQPRKRKDEVVEGDDEGTPAPKTDAKGRQPRKRRTTRRSTKDEDFFDDSAYEGFDYRLHTRHEYTQERCEELEKAYWRTLTYNNPLYGADMPGSLFDDTTTSWNVAKLENILDCLGQKLPGVNTAYLYLGMWKSTFAWHLEDVDLYSINYIHFGAPKQWYSICQEDAPKFEAVMKNIWASEAKKCSQFLRHKTFLVSPSLLAQSGIRVNKLVHHQGEFVITFPYGYHSGYNLGYNCAESVNFATESWLDYGRVAKKCECVEDAVWVDVEDIERRLRGEPTEGEEDEEDEGDEEDEDEELDESRKASDMPTPPESVDLKPRVIKKRKRRTKKEMGAAGAPIKKIRKVNLRVNMNPVEHCTLCPNHIPTEEMLSTDTGKKAHRLCAIYTPETYFTPDPITGNDIICNVTGIPKARLDLRCAFCKTSRKGACFQCSTKKCARAYHATCAAAAGVLTELKDVWVPGQDGQLIRQTDIDFRCRFHRAKRPVELDSETLEESAVTMDFGRSLIKGDVIQMQYYKGNIFAGVVMENRISEETVVVDILPKGDTVEVEWKWILATDPATNSSGPPDGTYSLGMAGGRQPTFQKTKPDPDDLFCDASSGLKWAEFVSADDITVLPEQAPIDLSQNFWYYLGELSTEYIPKYSEDPTKRVPNSNALPTPPKRTRTKPVAASKPPKPQTFFQIGNSPFPQQNSNVYWNSQQPPYHHQSGSNQWSVQYTQEQQMLAQGQYHPQQRLHPSHNGAQMAPPGYNPQYHQHTVPAPPTYYNQQQPQQSPAPHVQQFHTHTQPQLIGQQAAIAQEAAKVVVPSMPGATSNPPLPPPTQRPAQGQALGDKAPPSNPPQTQPPAATVALPPNPPQHQTTSSPVPPLPPASNQSPPPAVAAA